jgi:predicted  nucleic acid-binding Zn-ribbon protein
MIKTTGRQYHEDLNRAEQERDALKHQVDSIMKILTELNKREKDLHDTVYLVF